MQNNEHVAEGFLGNRASLFLADDIDQLIEALRRRLADPGRWRDEAALEEMLELWIVVEPALTVAETRELWPGIERRLSGSRVGTLAMTRGRN